MQEHQGQLLYVSVDAIQPPSFELRTEAEQANDPDFEQFCNSVRETGVIEPLVVRPVGNGKYELLAGGRRLKAAMLAPLKEVPVIVRADLSDIDSKILAISENMHRKDLSSVEKSRAVIALYQSAGYPEEITAKYLLRLHVDHTHGEAKMASAIVVPEHFKQICKKIGIGASRQHQLVKFGTLDEEVLDYALEKGLPGNKVMMLTW